MLKCDRIMTNRINSMTNAIEFIWPRNKTKCILRMIEILVFSCNFYVSFGAFHPHSILPNTIAWNVFSQNSFNYFVQYSKCWLNFTSFSFFVFRGYLNTHEWHFVSLHCTLYTQNENNYGKTQPKGILYNFNALHYITLHYIESYTLVTFSVK